MPPGAIWRKGVTPRPLLRGPDPAMAVKPCVRMEERVPAVRVAPKEGVLVLIEGVLRVADGAARVRKHLVGSGPMRRSVLADVAVIGVPLAPGGRLLLQVGEVIGAEHDADLAGDRVNPRRGVVRADMPW